MEGLAERHHEANQHHQNHPAGHDNALVAITEAHSFEPAVYVAIEPVKGEIIEVVEPLR